MGSILEGFLSQSARCDDPFDPAFDWSFAGCRIAYLLADGNRFSQADEPRQVVVDCVIRHATHGDGYPGGLPAGGQGNIEELACAFGIGEE